MSEAISERFEHFWSIEVLLTHNSHNLRS